MTNHESRSATTNRPARYECLDLWRGVACLMVVILHAGHYAKHNLPADAVVRDPAGHAIVSVVGRFGLGVQLFFVTSGYCIAATVDAARRKRSPGWQFFTRRFRRIFPPYWAALVLTAATVALATAFNVSQEVTTARGDEPALIPPVGELSLTQWIGNITLTEHWRWHFVGDPELKLLGPAWTLCYEEQFYAVCGILLLVTPRWFFAGVAMVSVATIALVFGTYACGRHIPSGLFCDGRWLLFAAGVSVYAHIAARPGWRRSIVPGLLTVAVLGSGWIRYVHLRGQGDPGSRQMAFEWLVGSGFALGLLALHRWDRWFVSRAAAWPLARCGQMCYSLYLIHWPVAILASICLYQAGVRGVWPTLLITIPVVTALSLLSGWLFHRFIERRFLNPPHCPPAADPAVAACPVPGPAASQATLTSLQRLTPCRNGTRSECP